MRDCFLQGKQSEFVSICIDHLLGGASKIILVGYSMGGLVVDRILYDGRVNNHILMSITIGSPHFHLPSFLIPEKHPPKLAVPTHEVPTVHILSGPGDLQVPVSSAWSGYTSQSFHNALTFEVDTDNIPGVWLTSSHKGLVSCNQLVRKIVPLILDSILMDSNGMASTDEVYRLMTKTLTTNTSIGVHMISNKMKVRESRTNDMFCKPVLDSVLVQEIGVRGKPGQSCFSWPLSDSLERGTVFQIAIHGLNPGKDINIVATDDKGAFDISNVFSPLPSLSIAEPLDNKRPWQEVIRGIDWMQNATWIAEIYSENLLKAGMRSLDIVLDSQHPLVPGQSFSVVKTRKQDRVMPQMDTAFNNHTVIEIKIPRMFGNYFGFLSKPSFPNISWRQLAWLIPLKLVSEAKSCSGVSREQSIIPIFITKNGAEQYPSDHVWKSEDHYRSGMPLWHPSSNADSVFLLVDARCQYSVRIELDILLAVSYSIRYHIYSLPGLLLGSSILRLVPVSRHGMAFVPESPNLKRYGLHCLWVLVQTIIASRFLNIWLPGSMPWLFILNPVGLLSMLCASFCLDIVIKEISCASFNAMAWILPRKTILDIRGGSLCTFLILLTCVFHDFLPFYFSLFCIYASPKRMSRHPTEYSSVEWYLILLYGAGPMAVAMSGGKVIGYRLRKQYGFASLERLLLIFIALASKRRKNMSPQSHPWRRSARAILSYVAILTSLFGLNFMPPFVVAILCLDDIR